MPRSLYIHIPFCLKRCIYCDFISGIYDPGKAGDYIDSLKKELSLLQAENPLDTLYIGGGTPTALTADSLSGLVRHIFSHFSFTAGYEATIEANPGTVDREKLLTLRSSGMNRISIGVQSFNDDELAFLGRIHSSKDAEQAVSLARETGFDNIGIDLIYGIPGQTVDRWLSTLQKAVELKPGHISTYELTVEEDTVLSQHLNRPVLPALLEEIPGTATSAFRRKAEAGSSVLAMPPEDRIIEMYELAIDHLSSAGYVHYEISNFALSGQECRHNINYWNRGEYYGTGLGAHSFVENTRYHNSGDLQNYLDALTQGTIPVERSETVTQDMAVAETFFLGLRMTAGIDLKKASETFRTDFAVRYQKELSELENAGFTEFDRDTGRLKLTRRGLLMSNEVFARFI